MEGADREDRIETIPFQDPSVPERFPEIPGTRLEEAMQLVGPEGRRWEGARAAEEALRLLPRWRVLGPLFRIPGVRRVAHVIYGQVARNRRRFGCGDHCGVSARKEGGGDGAA